MAVEHEYRPVVDFEDWYSQINEAHDGCFSSVRLAPVASMLQDRFKDYEREHRARTGQFWKLEMIADGEMLDKQRDLPNVSSGETAGIIRRMARNLVQHVPNVEIISKHDDDSVNGIFARHILLSKILGSEEYGANMQQSLFASTKTALTTGFSCTIPLMQQRADGTWFVKYDSVYYSDVFPEPGSKDIQDATDVFVRRYLTKGEVKALIRDQTHGWDVRALRTLLKSEPPNRKHESTDHQSRKHNTLPKGYEIITWYSSSGDAFLTFSATEMLLLRIEKNKHPFKWHPVHFLVLEHDDQQPLGKSQVELLLGRQAFQDLMLNGAMKLWYRNINPSIIGYGTTNASLNLSPGKFTQISNPNARIEAFETNTQTLLQYGTIAEQNLGSMVNLVGSADQQMAVQAGGGMSATPQGVEAQQALVDITTNNYQKAIESYVARYCSYALTTYFAELKGVKNVDVSADTRKRLINAGLKPDVFKEDGSLDIDFETLATEYFVRCIPGSLVEMEDEKQIRILHELLVPISQAMPALAAAGDQDAIRNTSNALQLIIEKTIELSGSRNSREIIAKLNAQAAPRIEEEVAARVALEEGMSNFGASAMKLMESQGSEIDGLKGQMSDMHEALGLIMKSLGVDTQASTETTPVSVSA